MSDDSDEDKALQTWLDLDAIQFPELPEASQEPDMSAIQLTSEDFSAMISGDTSDGTGTTIARQARTIRRLFTAYFLAKGKWREVTEAFIVSAKWGHQHELHGAENERARIVASLKAHDEHDIADAIERGEL